MSGNGPGCNGVRPILRKVTDLMVAGVENTGRSGTYIDLITFSDDLVPGAPLISPKCIANGQTLPG
jgi:hypothetical protein